MLEKRQKTCSSCETKYNIEWDIEIQDLEPLTCPFCGHEVNGLEDDEIWTNETNTDDSWD
jgi:DNA-directed RNA polymerase subunit RPC12/RpoP